MPQNYGLGLMIFLLYLGTLIAIGGTVASVKEHIRRENAKLFKAMVYLQHQSFSEREMKGIYPALCRAYGFEEIQ